jgi:light-regulated signal transduction histidine kinase (bacteriophytochrome)
VNRSAAQWLNLPRPQIEGKNLSEISGNFGSLKLAIGPLSLQPDEPLLGVEQTVTLPNGHTRWVQVDRVVLDGCENQPRSMVVVLTDISDRKSAEADLQRSNQDLERYAIVASHDLKEPLRAVSGYCRFLQEDYSESLDSAGRRFVEKAIEGADRMQQMVNDLLEYSRVSRAERPNETVDLNAIVAGVRVDLQQCIADTGAKITVEDLPTIRGSHGQLTQLFQNLLSNSMKFVPTDRKPCINIFSDCSEKALSVIVADNGLGIAESNRRRVFEIFQRLNRREDYPGTGLGLAICERIMDRHDGGIDIVSELGQGSQFHLRFPRHLEIA